MFKKKKIGLALSGGGAKGLFHIGVLKILEMNRIPIHMIAGTSMGCMVGALYSIEQNSIKLEQTARTFINSERFKRLNLSRFKEEPRISIGKAVSIFFRHRSLLESIVCPVLREQMNEFLSHIFPDIDIQDTKIPFIAVVVDLITGKKINLKKGPLRKAVQASISIPGYFQFVPWDDWILVDGGVASIVPVETLKENGADIVIASVPSKELPSQKNIRSDISVLLRTEDIMVDYLEKSELKNADFIIAGDIKNVNWFDFSKYEYCIGSGEKAALSKIDYIKKELKRKTFLQIFGNFFKKK